MASIVQFLPLLLTLACGAGAAYSVAIAKGVAVALAVLGAASILAGALLPFAPVGSRFAAFLAALGADAKAIAGALTGWKPPTPPAAIMLLAAFAMTSQSCALWSNTIEPILKADGLAFITCVESKLPQEIAALVALDAAAELQIAASCLGVSAASPTATANTQTVHQVAQSRLTSAKAAVHAAAPATSAK
jgi:hypothetical protein